MKFRNISKVHQGKFITRYNIEYETENGRIKTYEMISRNPQLQTFEQLRNNKTDAVVMIIHDKSGEKLLLNREFRMATGEWIYNFPAGLVDEGESYFEAARRELREETGLNLLQIDEIWKESYSAVGFSNEKTIVLVGTAEGEILPSDSELEEIEASWYTKEELKKILEEGNFAARTQTYCIMWSR